MAKLIKFIIRGSWQVLYKIARADLEESFLGDNFPLFAQR